MNNDCEMAGSMAAMYVSGIFTSSEDNKYPPYIRYDTMSVGDGEVTLKAEVRDYGDGGSGKEAYYVAVVFVRVDSLDTVIKGGFTNADYDAPDDADKQLQEKRSLYYIDDSFKKIVVAKTGLKPSYDEKGVMTIDLFDFLMDIVEL